MVDERGKLLARFIRPSRVRPGSTVKLARNFAPDHPGESLAAAGLTVEHGLGDRCP